jgi:hypothetical protein
VRIIEVQLHDHISLLLKSAHNLNYVIMSEKAKVVDHGKLIGTKAEIGEMTITPKDTSLYALGVGFNLGTS